MRSLPKPIFNTEEVFLTCISRIKNTDLKCRLVQGLTEVKNDATIFEEKANLSQLHQMPKKSIINENITKEELEKVYTYRMARKKAPGRFFYEKLRFSSNDGKCPFCGQRPASTLDHYLAKADYPTLVVTPTNLVPACKDCNFIKNSTFPTKSEEETLHPYFDDISENQWLYAEVIQTLPASLKYFIKPPDSATPLVSERVKYHFKMYELGELFASEAATELSDISYLMNKLFEKAGEESVREHLKEIAESCLHNRKNSWKTAMYQALSNDKWYCSEGARY